MISKLSNVLTIIHTDNNIFFSAYLNTKVQFNDIDPREIVKVNRSSVNNQTEFILLNQAPVEIPVETPIETPIEIPIEAPIETPIETPIEIPIKIPIEIPIETPIEIPTLFK
jgi:hypothetical protein